jgi:membrane protein DedA with SNARE-associated domain
MPVARFLALTALGSLIWNAVLIGAGWALGARWREATELVERADVWVYVAVVAAIALAFGAHHVRRARSDP